MAASPVDLIRQQLREKFPQAHGLRPKSEKPLLESHAFDRENFPVGAISEVVPGVPGAGIKLLVAALLGDPEEVSPHPEFVLIDGADAFNPASFSGKACSRLLWVRCVSAIGMLKAADLLALDGNVPFLLLDATGIPRVELNKLPASSWWRLKQTVERSGARLVVLSAMPLVPCASLRLSLSADLSLRDFDASTPELLERLRATTQQLRHAT